MPQIALRSKDNLSEGCYRYHCCGVGQSGWTSLVISPAISLLLNTLALGALSAAIIGGCDGHRQECLFVPQWKDDTVSDGCAYSAYRQSIQFDFRSLLPHECR